MFVYAETCTQGKGLPFTADDYESQVMTITDYAKLKGYDLRGSSTLRPTPPAKADGRRGFNITSPEVAERMKIVHARFNPPTVAAARRPDRGGFQQTIATQAAAIAAHDKVLAGIRAAF